MRARSETVGVMPQVTVTSVGPAGGRKGTRASVRSGGDHLAAGLPPPRRSPNKRRRLLAPAAVATGGRARPSGSDTDDEPLGSRSDVADGPSLFLSQDEGGDEDEDPQPEQHHDDYGAGFDSDIELGPDDVVPTIEGTGSAETPSPGRDRLWAPISRRPVAVEGSLSPLPGCFRPGWMRRTYATPSRTVARERTEEEEEEEEGSEVER